MTKEPSRNILFLGFGYVAQYFCKSCDSSDFKITSSINSSKEKYFKTPTKINTINFSKIDEAILDNYDNFVISIPPFYQKRSDIIIDKFHHYFLNRKSPYKLIYLCATSVYGDHSGKKVQENSELKSESINGLARIECEKKYLQLQKNKLANIIILRLAGIYGEKRNAISAIKNKEITSVTPSTKIISRIHVADISKIIRNIILSPNIKNEIFNLCDNDPCPTKEVQDYICEELLKIEKLPIENQVRKNTNLSFSLDNKIVDNSKIKKILNYEFLFPSYKKGLEQV